MELIFHLSKFIGNILVRYIKRFCGIELAEEDSDMSGVIGVLLLAILLASLIITIG
jgi:hypothetical protein